MTSSDLQHPVVLHGDQEIGAGVEQADAGALPMSICCGCTPHHVMRDGSLPASHGYCEIYTAREMARLDAIEAGEADQLIGLVTRGYAHAIAGGLDLLFGKQRELVDVPPVSPVRRG